MLNWIWLAEGLGYGAQNSEELLRAYPGGASQIFSQLHTLALRAHLKQKQYEKLSLTSPQDYATLLEKTIAMGIQPLCFQDKNYPALLKLTDAPPPVLYVKGDASLFNKGLNIAMVGTRRPSVYGIDTAQFIGKELAKLGAVLVSGLAAGLDAEAHKAAISEKAPTIACIAFGHDMCYPAANRSLMKVIEKTGAVVSEYPPEAGCEKPYFLQRNRLIAGISHGLVVVEARHKSGTMSTVNFAAEYGRDIFAVPGSIFSELSKGTNHLIAEGAHPAIVPHEILDICSRAIQPSIASSFEPAQAYKERKFEKREDIQLDFSFIEQADEAQRQDTFEIDIGEMPESQSLPQLAGEKAIVFKALGTAPRTVDDVCVKTGLLPAQVMSFLTQLELEGYITQLAGRKFCVKH